MLLAFVNMAMHGGIYMLAAREQEDKFIRFSSIMGILNSWQLTSQQCVRVQGT